MVRAVSPSGEADDSTARFVWLVAGSSSLLACLHSLACSILHASPLCRRRRQLYIFVFASKIEWVIQPVSGRVNEQP